MFFSYKTWVASTMIAALGLPVLLSAAEPVSEVQNSVIQLQAYEQDSVEENTIQQVSLESIFDGGACSSCQHSSCGCQSDGGYLSFLESDEKLLADLRNVPLGDCWKLSVGGALRYRYIDEDNRLRPNGPNRSTYDQWRFNPFVEFQYSDWFKAHIEAIDASTFDNDMPALGIDVNRSDLLQAYADIKLLDMGEGTLSARYGRQFLQYGSQHLVSPLAWSNTFRTFEGLKLYYQSDLWDVDGFATQSVNFPAGNVWQPTSFDNPDENRWFSGVYTTYKGLSTGPVDFYWLWLRDDEPAANRLDGNRHTIGTRWEGKAPVKDCCGKVARTYIWDIEGGWQWGTDDFGTATDATVNAGFISLMAGHVWNQVAWTPTVKGVFYWASGDDDPNDNEINTFTPLYPLGHAYWGIIDNLNGSNLVDYSIQASVKPTKKLTLGSDFHWFQKDESADFIYNVAGAPLGPNNTDSSIGNEWDIVGTYQINANLQWQCGFSTFWYGDAVTQTALSRPDAQQLYTLVNWTF
ncbi:MAG: alginate export family protein [Planctomycetaceae bacterium]|nr:alginate export family protein [Planctomycetaceae bacterium]